MQKFKDLFTYEKLIILDTAFLVLHVLYAFISFNHLSWIMLFGVRVPRIILNVMAKKKVAAKAPEVTTWQGREYIFRQWTTFLYFPIALIFTLIGGYAMTCTLTWKPGCMSAYVITMIIFLGIYTVIDFYIWQRIVKPQLAESFAQYDKERKAAAQASKEAAEQRAPKQDGAQAPPASQPAPDRA